MRLASTQGLRAAMGALMAASVFLCLETPAAYGADPILNVSLNRDRIYLGESAILTVKISGSDASTPPDLSAITNASVRLLGTHISVAWANGRPGQQSSIGRVFAYEVRPAVAGPFPVGPIRYEANARVMTHPGPVLQVAGIEAQDWVDLSVTASSDSVLVDEPFDVTLSVFLRRLPAPFEAADPLLPDDPPALRVPFLDNRPIEGLDGPDIHALLNPLLVRRKNEPGFRLNDYTVQRDIFDFDFDDVFSEKRALFRLERKPAERNGKPCFEYAVTARYTPRKEGTYTFGPAEFKGTAITNATNTGQASTRPVFAVGPACTVRVIPPPDEGRPASFVGALGTNLAVDATLDTSVCSVGDPLRFTLSLAGVRLDTLAPPALEQQPDVLKDFRVYEDFQAETRDNRREYVWTIRPIRAGTYEFPSLPLSFYHTARRTYETVWTRPIPLQVNPAASIEASNIVFTATNSVVLRTSSDEDDWLIVAPLDVDPLGATSVPSSPMPWQIVLLIAGPAVWILAETGRFIALRIPAFARFRKRRGAASRAICRLRNLDATDPSVHREVCGILRDFLNDRFHVASAGMGPRDARHLIEKRLHRAELADRFAAILERHFNASFEGAPSAHTPRETVDLSPVLDVVREVDAAGPHPRLPKPSRLLLLLLPAVLWASASLRADDSESRFIWDQANAAMATASAPADFMTAAGLYAELELRGVRNGPLFYNMGTALLLAGDRPQARRYLLRAERYDGSRADIRHNLILAMAEGNRPTQPELPWYRIPLFWHFGLAWRLRLSVVVMALAGLWLSLILRRRKDWQWVRALFGISLALGIAFGSSVATSWSEERREIPGLRHESAPADKAAAASIKTPAGP